MARPPLRLYELVLANGRSASPYVWRVRYAMAHKGLPCESVPLGFTEIQRVFAGRFKTVPVLEDGETQLAESWDIVEYLDRVFPERPLFSSPAEHAMVRLFDMWFSIEVQRRMIGVYVLDVHNAARAEDRGYFRQSREARFKAPLEALVADRASRLPALREAFQPLRLHLARFPYLGGASPNYADYIALASLQWVGSVSTLPLLGADDEALRAWLQRGFDLYGGLGRDPRLQPLVE
jgi:glutathione S-transferase